MRSKRSCDLIPVGRGTECFDLAILQIWHSKSRGAAGIWSPSAYRLGLRDVTAGCPRAECQYSYVAAPAEFRQVFTMKLLSTSRICKKVRLSDFNFNSNIPSSIRVHLPLCFTARHENNERPNSGTSNTSLNRIVVTLLSTSQYKLTVPTPVIATVDWSARLTDPDSGRSEVKRSASEHM